MSERTGRGYERIDDPDSGSALARESYEAMAVSSRYLGSAGAIRRFVGDQARSKRKDRPLRVLDIGAGACDIAEDIARWAKSQSLPVQFTCIDPNIYAVRRARQRLSGSPDLNVVVRCERIENHTSDFPYDCAVGSLFFHHFQPHEILEIITHLRTMVRRSVFINDLQRHPVAFMGFLALGPALAPGVWHDGLNSIRRGFQACELQSLLERLPGVEVSARSEMLFRVTATVRFLRNRGKGVKKE